MNISSHWPAWCVIARRALVSFTNPLAAGSGLVERTPKKVAPPPIWSFSSPSFVVQRNTKLPKNWEIHVTVSAPSRMTKSGEEGLLTIVTTFVSEIYFSMWFLESSCVDDSEYVPNLPAAMYIFFTTSVQSKNLTFLGVRSTNPLPAASGLVKLTRWLCAAFGCCVEQLTSWQLELDVKLQEVEGVSPWCQDLCCASWPACNVAKGVSKKLWMLLPGIVLYKTAMQPCLHSLQR